MTSKPATHAAVSSLDHPSDIPLTRLWFGLLAAPAAWVAQGGIGWFLGGRICTAMSVGAVRATLGAVSLAALAVGAWGLVTAWQNWRSTGDDSSVDAWDRVVFMSMGGILVSASFLIGIVWAGLTPMLIGACGGMR